MNNFKTQSPIYKRIEWAMSDFWRFQIVRRASQLKYFVNGGHVCSVCESRVKFINYTVEGPVGDEHTKMIFSNSGKKFMCPHCIANRIDYYFFLNDKVLKRGRCAFTGKLNVPVIDIIWGTDNDMGLEVRFGGNWWNGHYACKEAFVELLTQSGYVRTDRLKYDEKMKRWFYTDGIFTGTDQPVTEFI